MQINYRANSFLKTEGEKMEKADNTVSIFGYRLSILR